MPKSALMLGGLVAVSLSVAACDREVGLSTDDGKAEVSAGPLYVDQEQLSTEVRDQLTKKLGTQAGPVSCPANLKPFTGETTTCTLTAPDGTYDVAVTITKVDWTGFGNFGVGNAVFDAKVADKPNA